MVKPEDEPIPRRQVDSPRSPRWLRVSPHMLFTLKGQREQIRLLERAREQQALVLRLNNLLVSHLEPEELFQAMSSVLWQEIRHEFMALSLLESDGLFDRVIFLHAPNGQDLPGEPLRGPLSESPSGEAIRSKRVDVLGPERLALVSPILRHHLQAAGILSMCAVPLVSRGKTLGALSFGSCELEHFSNDETDLLSSIGIQFAIALDNALVYKNIQNAKDKLVEENLFFAEEININFSTGEIIGKSAPWKNVLKQISTVAASNATVLLNGETGTGKELLATAIHDRSCRNGKNFIKLNCSAIPLGLLESELFGHERGAFTGAVQRKIGRFELAHNGTLFLDEIGDLPLELQPKLLRAIQEREFERLGSTTTQKVDVRIVAATHRNLANMVESGQFRQDLFYRLNVFPIDVPPLRNRRDDIPLLIAFFAQKFATQMNKTITTIPKSTMARLSELPWPGNIRELQNIVERSVILSQGPELRVPLADLELAPDVESKSSNLTLEEVQRQEIRRVIRECRGVIGGPTGAAARLGMKRSTLNSRMKKLGIFREGPE